MTDTTAFTNLQNSIALTLLPLGWHLRIADGLRRGCAPARLLDQLGQEFRNERGESIADLRRHASEAMKRGRELGIEPVPWDSASYPVALTTIVDPPPVLWVRGAIEVLNRDAVAIVGARAASPYGLSVAERLAADLAATGLVIVSGMARGVDSAAHRGALSVGGLTIAVLGSGVDVMYPPEHTLLAGDIAAAGAVISELVPGTPPLPHFFPMRNRIISGLCRAVVVIEAGQKSGSLITAKMALEQGRDVLAVPGNVLSGRNRGAHGLLRDGAKIVESADDILEELGMPSAVRKAAGSMADPVLASLTPGEASDLDAIAQRTGLSPTRLLPRLLELELAGAVARVGGGKFVRTDGSC
jgi:DNA processing protein